MRRNAKVDANHAEVVEEFRKLGASVLSLAMLGKGVPDLLVSWCGVTMLVEVKAPKGKLSTEQSAFLDRIRGAGGVAFMARNYRDVMRELSIYTSRKPQG